MLRQLRVKINGDVWRVRYLKTKTFNKLHGKHNAAMTWYNHKKKKRIIDFKCSDFCKTHVTHEVVHAYLSYFDFSRMSYGRIEEKMADLFGNKEKFMMKVRDSIYGAFR